jgi:hypothetical protein
MLNRSSIFALAAVATVAVAALAPTSASARGFGGGGFGGGHSFGGGGGGGGFAHTASFGHTGSIGSVGHTTSFGRTAGLGHVFRNGGSGRLAGIGPIRHWPILGIRVNPTGNPGNPGMNCWHKTNCGGGITTGGNTIPPGISCIEGTNGCGGGNNPPCLINCGHQNPPPCVKLWGCGPHPLPPIVWWHKHHFHWGVVDYDGDADVDTADTVNTVATPAAPCNCLTKQYLDDGSVLFQDICTKEAALATPDELKAQAAGIPPQGQTQTQ